MGQMLQNWRKDNPGKEFDSNKFTLGKLLTLMFINGHPAADVLEFDNSGRYMRDKDVVGYIEKYPENDFFAFRGDPEYKFDDRKCHLVLLQDISNVIRFLNCAGIDLPTTLKDNHQQRLERIKQFKEKAHAADYILARLCIEWMKANPDKSFVKDNDFDKYKVLMLIFFTATANLTHTTDGLTNLFEFHAYPQGPVERDVRIYLIQNLSPIFHIDREKITLRIGRENAAEIIRDLSQKATKEELEYLQLLSELHYLAYKQ